MQKKKKKKKALTLKKKTQKALQPIKKKQVTEKSTKKHYGAFKSTHYNPCYLCGQESKSKENTKMAAILKLQVRITKYLMYIHGGHMCICIPNMKLLYQTQCQGEVCTDDDADDGQFMIVQGSLVDKPNKPTILYRLDNTWKTYSATRMCQCHMCSFQQTAAVK